MFAGSSNKRHALLVARDEHGFEIKSLDNGLGSFHHIFIRLHRKAGCKRQFVDIRGQYAGTTINRKITAFRIDDGFDLCFSCCGDGFFDDGVGEHTFRIIRQHDHRSIRH